MVGKKITYLLKEGEHAQGDHVLSEVVTHLQDESSRHLLQDSVVHIGRLQPLGFLEGGREGQKWI